MRRVILVTLSALLLVLACARTEVDPAELAGSWVGEINVMGQTIDFEVELAVTDDGLAGTLSIPAQYVFDWPLVEVELEGDRLSFTLPVPEASALYTGRYADGVIGGEFSQAGVVGVFELRRQIVPELPYPTEEVLIETEHGPRLAGTLSLPVGDGPFPAVLLITGSGAQNRDEQIFGFRPFALIADHLAREGIASLRCDDRGVGGSTGDPVEMTTEDKALDYAAQLAYLKERPEIGPVYLLGHSEGSLVAGMLAAEDPEVAGIIMLAGQAVTGEEVLLTQSVAVIRAEGGDEEKVEWNQDLQRRIFAALRTGDDLGEVYEEMRRGFLRDVERLRPEERAMIGDVDEWVEAMIEQQRAMMESPWILFYLDYDPWEHLSRVGCPILALYGEFDVQVLPGENAAALEEKAGRHGLEVTIITIPGVNHLFQLSETGKVSEYPTLEPIFAPGVLETISDWLKER